VKNVKVILLVVLPKACAAAVSGLKRVANALAGKKAHPPNNIKMKSFKTFILENRQFINWDENYGKTFKLVHTPEGRQSEGSKWTPDLISVVTPENGDAWNSWKEVPFEILSKWKINWNQIQKSLGQHKYDQIIRSKQKLSNN
jgi:hypothetical protein